MSELLLPTTAGPQGDAYFAIFDGPDGRFRYEYDPHIWPGDGICISQNGNRIDPPDKGRYPFTERVRATEDALAISELLQKLMAR